MDSWCSLEPDTEKQLLKGIEQFRKQAVDKQLRAVGVLPDGQEDRDLLRGLEQTYRIHGRLEDFEGWFLQAAYPLTTAVFFLEEGSLWLSDARRQSYADFHGKRGYPVTAPELAYDYPTHFFTIGAYYLWDVFDPRKLSLTDPASVPRKVKSALEDCDRHILDNTFVFQVEQLPRYAPSPPVLEVRTWCGVVLPALVDEYNRLITNMLRYFEQSAPELPAVQAPPQPAASKVAVGFAAKTGAAAGGAHRRASNVQAAAALRAGDADVLEVFRAWKETYINEEVEIELGLATPDTAEQTVRRKVEIENDSDKLWTKFYRNMLTAGIRVAKRKGYTFIAQKPMQPT